MSDAVVVDTNVLSWLFEQRPNPLRDRYRSLIGERRVLVAFQTVLELRYRALHAGWGELRRRRLEGSLGELTVIQPDDALVNVCAELRHACDQAGHGLGGKGTTATCPEPALRMHSWVCGSGPEEEPPVASCGVHDCQRR